MRRTGMDILPLPIPDIGIRTSKSPHWFGVRLLCHSRDWPADLLYLGYNSYTGIFQGVTDTCSRAAGGGTHDHFGTIDLWSVYPDSLLGTVLFRNNDCGMRDDEYLSGALHPLWPLYESAPIVCGIDISSGPDIGIYTLFWSFCLALYGYFSLFPLMDMAGSSRSGGA